MFSIKRISHIAKLWPNAAMTIDEIRYNNLLLLIREAGNNQAEVARRVETSPSYISQIISRLKTRNGTVRNVGVKLARRLEKSFDKPKGWMDEDHTRRPGGISERPLLYIGGDTRLSEAETELILLARKFGLTEDFLRISRKHITGSKK